VIVEIKPMVGLTRDSEDNLNPVFSSKIMYVPLCLCELINKYDFDLLVHAKTRYSECIYQDIIVVDNSLIKDKHKDQINENTISVSNGKLLDFDRKGKSARIITNLNHKNEQVKIQTDSSLLSNKSLESVSVILKLDYIKLLKLVSSLRVDINNEDSGERYESTYDIGLSWFDLFETNKKYSPK